MFAREIAGNYAIETAPRTNRRVGAVRALPLQSKDIGWVKPTTELTGTHKGHRPTWRAYQSSDNARRCQHMRRCTGVKHRKIAVLGEVGRCPCKAKAFEADHRRYQLWVAQRYNLSNTEPSRGAKSLSYVRSRCASVIPET